MQDRLRPGSKGEPLPEGQTVFRLGKPTKDGFVASPVHFELSTKDEQSELQALSVWVEGLTTVQQSLEFIESNREALRLVLYLSVDTVRGIRPDPDSLDVPPLDVVWDPLTLQNGNGTEPDTRPGAEGHAGITGLKRPPRVSRTHYKSIRSQLADLAVPETLA
jgi:hypothetical protein